MKKEAVYILISVFVILGIILISSVNLDLNHDGVINITDLQLIASHFQGKGSYNVSYDLNNNSKIDLFDLVSVAREVNLSSNSSGGVVLGNQSLLANYTVNANNTLSGPVPSGWTLVDVQSFENGSYNTGESPVGLISQGTAISTIRAHGGTHSLDSYIKHSFGGYGLKIVGSAINSRTVYVSYWRYVTDSDPGYGYMDTNWFMLVRSPPGYGQGFGVQLDAPPPNSCCMALSGHITVFGSTLDERPFSGTGNLWGYTPGVWQHIEVYLKVNDPGKTNGELDFYVDGIKKFTCDAATNCPHTDANHVAGMFANTTDYATGNLYIGGDWGKDVWYTDANHTICSTNGDMGMGPVNVNMSNPQCPNQAPPNGTVPYFHIDIDDVVVLKK